jgi:PilZ domain
VEQRRARRFTLQLPVSVTRNGTERIIQSGLTKNISSGGVLFTAQKEPDVGASIEYVIALGGPSEQHVSLRCIGKVLRANRLDSGETAYEIAATLERYEFVRPEE